MVRLTKPQIEILSLHLGTNRASPRHKIGNQYFREFHFPTHPTAMSLQKRGLLDWRGYDANSAGGWFITKEGIAALAKSQSAS